VIGKGGVVELVRMLEIAWIWKMAWKNRKILDGKEIPS
jgi:hypothetical protein